MPTGRVVEAFAFGGVDSRSNPLAMPPGKCLRSVNWVRAEAGYLKLRHGYSNVTMSTVSAVSIHSAVAIQQLKTSLWERRILFGQGNAVKALELGAVGTVTGITTMPSTLSWGSFLLDNLFFWGTGWSSVKSFDGTTARFAGLGAPAAASCSSVSVSESTAATGTWSGTTLSGFQFYMAWYRPQTGEVGNRTAIGSRLTIPSTSTQSVVVLTGLPDPAGDSEVVKLLGRTPDGGEVPYALVTSTGSWVVAGNTATVATINLWDVDYDSELPTRNIVPPSYLQKFAVALGRVYAVGDPEADSSCLGKVFYSESESDIEQGAFVGRPVSCWPANNCRYFPTGEHPRGVHGVENEAWVFTRNHLGILSELGTVYAGDGQSHPDWRAIFPGGLAGQRAFTMTRYGPFWVNADKQIVTMGPAGPVPVSGEHEGALLGKIADSAIEDIEVAWHLDPSKHIDRLYVKATDDDGAPVVVVHDFGIGGQGYEYEYSGMTPTVLVRGCQGMLSALDVNDVARLWAGNEAGRIVRLEEGDSDNGATYSADAVARVNLGPGEPLFSSIGFTGDSNVVITASRRLDLDLTDLNAVAPCAVTEIDKDAGEYRARIEEGGQFMLLRLQLTSHHADGTLDDGETPGLPVNLYGRVYAVRPEFGMGALS